MRWALVLALTAAYPLIVYFSLGHVEPRYLALLLLALGAPALAGRRRAGRAGALGGARRRCCWPPAPRCSTPACRSSSIPVLVNLVLLTVFGLSLLRGPSIAERIARIAGA